MSYKESTKAELPGNRNSGQKGARKKGQKRRQQIIDVTKEILISDGYNSLVLREVAEQIGITHGNLQYYFPTKNDLLIAIFDQEVEKYTESLKEAVSATTTKQGKLAAIIDAGLAELKKPETALWRVLLSLADHSPEMASILKKENDLYEKVLAEELKIVAGDLSEQRRRHIARIIHAILDGLGVQYVYEDYDSPEMRAFESEIKVALSSILEVE